MWPLPLISWCHLGGVPSPPSIRCLLRNVDALLVYRSMIQEERREHTNICLGYSRRPHRWPPWLPFSGPMTCTLKLQFFGCHGGEALSHLFAGFCLFCVFESPCLSLLGPGIAGTVLPRSAFSTCQLSFVMELHSSFQPLALGWPWYWPCQPTSVEVIVSSPKW